jgi:hypothetical protein
MTQEGEADKTASFGKTRTWWHPLLVSLLKKLLGDAYEVQAELHVGRIPLRVDVALIRREGGDLPEPARRDLALLVEHLNRFTLLEFKGPTDALERGDLDYVVGLAHLYRSQQAEGVHHTELTLMVLAPTKNKPFDDELALSGYAAEELERGVHRIGGPTFPTLLIETDYTTGADQPVLTLFSRAFLRETRRIMDQLSTAGYAPLMQYVVQQIEQFHEARESFAMHHKDTQVMEEVFRDAKEAVLKMLTVEERLRGLPPEERVRGLPPEERVRGLPPEERVRGLTPEERLKGLSPEELDRLRKLLGVGNAKR